MHSHNRSARIRNMACSFAAPPKLGWSGAAGGGGRARCVQQASQLAALCAVMCVPYCVPRPVLHISTPPTFICRRRLAAHPQDPAPTTAQHIRAAALVPATACQHTLHCLAAQRPSCPPAAVTWPGLGRGPAPGRGAPSAILCAAASGAAAVSTGGSAITLPPEIDRITEGLPIRSASAGGSVVQGAALHPGGVGIGMPLRAAPWPPASCNAGS